MAFSGKRPDLQVHQHIENYHLHRQEKYTQPAEVSLNPSIGSPNTPRRLALGASDVCLVGQSPIDHVPSILALLWGRLVKPNHQGKQP